MQQLYNDTVTVTYHHGSYIKLSTDWRDKNIICPNSKIYYVTKGEICVEVGTDVYTARRGDAILIPAGVKHTYHLGEAESAEKYWFHFDMRYAQTNYFDLVDFGYIRHIGTDEETRRLFSTVVNTSGNTPTEKLLLLSAISSIVSIFLEGCEFARKESEKEDETDKVITHIKKNYFDKFTLEDLADMAKLSPNHFAKKFKEKVGSPPLKYINTLRIERAKFLLEHTEKPINQVMEEIGFWDSAHFSKLFKSETGYSPSKFRRALAKRKINR